MAQPGPAPLDEPLEAVRALIGGLEFCQNAGRNCATLIPGGANARHPGGAHYGEEEIPPEWRERLALRGAVERCAQELYRPRTVL